MGSKLTGIALGLAVAAAVAGCNRGGDEAQHWDTTTGAPQQRMADRTVLNQQSGMAARLDARLLDEQANAGQKRARIEVSQQGILLVSPQEPPTPNDATRGYIEYRVDDGAPQYTEQTQFSVTNLQAGEREISVRLVDTAKHGLTEYKRIRVKIPE